MEVVRRRRTRHRRRRLMGVETTMGVRHPFGVNVVGMAGRAPRDVPRGPASIAMIGTRSVRSRYLLPIYLGINLGYDLMRWIC